MLRVAVGMVDEGDVNGEAERLHDQASRDGEAQGAGARPRVARQDIGQSHEQEWHRRQQEAVAEAPRAVPARPRHIEKEEPTAGPEHEQPLGAVAAQHFGPSQQRERDGRAVDEQRAAHAEQMTIRRFEEVEREVIEGAIAHLGERPEAVEVPGGEEQRPQRGHAREGGHARDSPLGPRGPPRVGAKRGQRHRRLRPREHQRRRPRAGHGEGPHRGPRARGPQREHGAE